MHLLAHRLHTVAPDLPGFGRSAALDATTTFDRLAEVIEGFTDAVGLERFSLYMFDFGAPVGFRLALRRPERIERLVLQNGNAYEAGLGPGMQALAPYWTDRAGNESAVRGFLALDATLPVPRRRPRPRVGQPRSLGARPALPRHGRPRPRHAGPALRLPEQRRRLPALARVPARAPAAGAAALGQERHGFFPPAGAQAYLADLPDAQVHLLDTGHFATATHSAEIAELILAFFKPAPAA
jgi:pimeloyl-ACP methyl ester carboxylesterase